MLRCCTPFIVKHSLRDAESSAISSTPGRSYPAFDTHHLLFRTLSSFSLGFFSDQSKKRSLITRSVIGNIEPVVCEPLDSCEGSRWTEVYMSSCTDDLPSLLRYCSSWPSWPSMGCDKADLHGRGWGISHSQRLGVSNRNVHLAKSSTVSKLIRGSRSHCNRDALQPCRSRNILVSIYMTRQTRARIHSPKTTPLPFMPIASTYLLQRPD